jgi:hypothetical protein
MDERRWQQEIKKEVAFVRDCLDRMETRMKSIEESVKSQRIDLQNHVNDEMHDFRTVKAHIAEIVDLLKQVDFSRLK